MLSGKEKKIMKSQANQIKASVTIGREGMSSNVEHFIDEAFNNKNLVKNAIILILSLFEELPLDIYDNTGQSVRELKQDDKNSYISHLRSEYATELPN